MSSGRQNKKDLPLSAPAGPSAGMPVRGAAAGCRVHWKVERSVVIHAINAGFRLLGRYARAGLKEDGLIDSARRQTGLDDFGALPFQEPLRRLIDSMETEARLNPMGRLAAREDLIRLLANNLRMEEERKRNPAIAGGEIRRPVFITGLPRTGTTFLHSLLALDPANRVPLTWETVYPSPPPDAATYHTDPRIRRVDNQIKWFRRLVRGFDRIHPVGA